MPPGRSRLLLLLAFALSGYAALSYEMSWTRQLVSLFGVTYHAITTILVTFMAGLALGSWTAGRLIDRMRVPPLLALAALEVFLGVYAQLFTPLQGLVEGGYLALASGGDLSIATHTTLRFVFGSMLLLPPALASGATLPVASRAFVLEQGRLRQDLATLYGANVAGAMAGCFCTTFFTIGLLGYPMTAWLGTYANGLAALIVFWLYRQQTAATPAAAPVEAPAPRTPWHRERSVIGGTYLVVGGSALALEILWTRVLSQAGWNAATYVFGFVLGAFLFGHALGAGVVFRRWLIRLPPRRLFIALPAVMGGLTILSVLMLVPRISPELWQNFGPLKSLGLYMPLLRAGLIVPAVILPAMVSGALFPLASYLSIPRLDGLGTGVGNLAALSTVGGILGAFVTGFWLLPNIGAVRSLVLFGCLDLVVAAWVGWALAGRPGRTALRRAWMATAGGLVLFGAMAGTINPASHMLLMPGEQVLAFSEGRNSSTAVLQPDPTEIVLFIHGERLGIRGGGSDVAVAAGLHPDPRSIAVIGFGTGSVVADALEVPAFERVRAIDFNGDLLKMVPFTRGEDAPLFEQEHFQFIDNDGRHYLLTNDTTFDIIVNDAAIYAWYLELSTLEFNQLAKSRLGPNGLYVGRLHPYRITDDAYEREIATFLEVFPNAAALVLSPDIVMLIGRNGDMPLREPTPTRALRRTWLDAGELAAIARGRLITDAYPLHLPDTFLATDRYPTGDGTMMPPDVPGTPVHPEDRHPDSRRPPPPQGRP